MTDQQPVPQPLGEKIELYFDPEVAEFEDHLADLLQKEPPPEWVEPFLEQWRELRTTRWMSTETWYELTGREFKDSDALYVFVEEVSARLGLQ